MEMGTGKTKVAVASLADAWIETSPECLQRVQVYVASLADAWIETSASS